ncbi:neuropeptide FF receptor 2-like isoform X2 [Pomacea canaliculata]|nr:neuropeptide FF receptor 2-like isoform X2 [Pomacea canaliculata]
MTLRCVPGERVIEIEYPPEFFEKFNSSIPANTYPPWEVALKILSYVLAMIMDVGGNALVIFIVVVSKRMRTPTNVLLVNLAVADLLVAALCMWVHLGANITPEWPFGLLICKVNMFAQATAITSSVLTLTVISVERFVAIVFPLRPGFTLRSTGAAIVAVWIVACAIAAPQLHVRYVQEVKWRNRHVIQCLERWPSIMMLLVNREHPLRACTTHSLPSLCSSFPSSSSSTATQSSACACWSGSLQCLAPHPTATLARRERWCACWWRWSWPLSPAGPHCTSWSCATPGETTTM